MNTSIHNRLSESSRLTLVQFLCLVITGVLEFLVLAFGTMWKFRFHYLLRVGTFGCSLLFLAVLLIQVLKYRKKYPLGAACAAVVWFLAVQQIHSSQHMDPHPFGLFLSVYLLAFPFACVTRDEDRQLGLRVAAMLYMAAAFVLVLDLGLLFAGCVPKIWEKYIFWDGTRLHAVMHPNISARVFMIGIGFCLGFCFQTHRKPVKGLLAVLTSLFFAALSLTNSRAAVLLTCALISAAVFLHIFKGTRKQFLAGAAAAVAVMAALVLCAQALFLANGMRLTRHMAEQQNQAAPYEAASEQSVLSYGLISLSSVCPVPAAPEYTEAPGSSVSVVSLSSESVDIPAPTAHSVQGTFINDLPTLNNRTLIWNVVFQKILQEPTILLWGIDDTTKIVNATGGEHTHNSWLEILVRLGLPGFLLCLFFTVQAVWSSMRLIFHPTQDMWRKIIALLLICLLVSSVLEPSLFFSEESWHFVDFLFFLCLGYVIQWRKQLSGNTTR